MSPVPSPSVSVVSEASVSKSSVSSLVPSPSQSARRSQPASSLASSTPSSSSSSSMPSWDPSPSVSVCWSTPVTLTSAMLAEANTVSVPPTVWLMVAVVSAPSMSHSVKTLTN